MMTAIYSHSDQTPDNRRGTLLSPALCMALYSVSRGMTYTAPSIVKCRLHPESPQFKNRCRSLRQLLKKQKAHHCSNANDIHYSGSSTVRLIEQNGIQHRAEAAFRLEAAIWRIAHAPSSVWPEPCNTDMDSLIKKIIRLPTGEMDLLASALLGEGEHKYASLVLSLPAPELLTLNTACFGEARDAQQQELTRCARSKASERYRPIVFEIDFQAEPVIPKRVASPSPARTKTKRRPLLFAAICMSLFTILAFGSRLITMDSLFELLTGPDRQQITQLQQEVQLDKLNLALADDRNTWYGFAWSNFSLGHYHQSQDMMQTLLNQPETGPHLRARAHYTLGAIHSNAWRFTKADRHFTQADHFYNKVESARGIRAVKMERVALLQRTGDLDQALNLLQELTLSGETDARIHKLAANLYFELGDPISSLLAAEKWEQTTDVYSQILEAKSHQAWCLIETGDIETGAALTWDVENLALSHDETRIYYYNLINHIALGFIDGKEITQQWLDIAEYAQKSGNMDLMRHLDITTSRLDHHF